MSNELTALTDFTRNLFKHAYLVLPWFCVNSGRSEYKVDQYNKALSVIKLLKKNKPLFFSDDAEHARANAELNKFYKTLAPAGGPEANKTALAHYVCAWDNAWKNRAVLQLRGHEIKLMKYFHEIISGEAHSHLPELLSMARLLDTDTVRIARLVSIRNGWTAKQAFSDKTKEMKRLKNKLFGTKAPTIDLIKTVSKKRPKLFKEFQQVIKDRKHAAQIRLIEIFDKEDFFPTVDSEILRPKLKTEALDEFLPDDFKGQIGVQPAGYPLTFYTHQGLELEMPPLNNVIMNDNYGKAEQGKEYNIHPVEDGTFYCETKAVEGNTRTKYYTLEYKRRAREIKYDKVQKLAQDIADVRKRMLIHVASKDRDTRVRALMCLFIDSHYARIGNPDSAKGKKKTYGVTTLLTKKHVKIKGDKIIISYNGKHCQKQKHELSIYRSGKEKLANPQESMISDKLLELIEEKNEYLFTRSDGNPFTPQQVNDYFTGPIEPDYNNSLPEGGAGSPCTVHNLRNYHATVMFIDKVNSFNTNRTMASFSDVLTTYKEIIDVIATYLGNTAGICRKAYIEPTEQLLFFKQWGYRPPDMLKKDLFVNEPNDTYQIEDKIKKPRKRFKFAAQRKVTSKTRRKLSNKSHDAAQKGKGLSKTLS